MNPGQSAHMKSLCKDAHYDSTFTNVEDSAPQFTQFGTLQTA